MKGAGDTGSVHKKMDAARWAASAVFIDEIIVSGL